MNLTRMLSILATGLPVWGQNINTVTGGDVPDGTRWSEPGQELAASLEAPARMCGEAGDGMTPLFAG